MKLADYILRIRTIGEDLWLAYLLSWSEWPVGSQRVAVETGVCEFGEGS